MNWPPSKAWTSATFREGYRHFVAINYGGKGESRWVNLVSVLDGKACFQVEWKEMKDSTKWISGWASLNRNEAILSKESQIINNTGSNRNDKTCLHPSIDSGLAIPFEKNNLRPWFDEKNGSN